MEEFVCLSQYFVNKQNIRSFDNILIKKILKCEEDAVFHKHLFGDQVLTSDISNELLIILRTMKSNLRSKSQQDFKNYFNVDEGSLKSVNKEEVFKSCWKGISDVIPKDFCGSYSNTKILRDLTHSIIYSMKRQHMFITKYLKKWDFSVNPWKSLPNKDTINNLLYYIILWICKFVLSAIICLNFYVTTCKVDSDEYKLHYFWKHHWQSFYDKKISGMIFTKVLKRFEPLWVSKKQKNKCINERTKLKALKRDIPKLHLLLKSDNDCRPIVRYKSEQPNSAEKYKIKNRLSFLKMLTGKPMQKLETQFSQMYEEWVKLNKPKLFFVKTDLSNAFGSINREKLMQILSMRHLNYQKTEKNVYAKKKVAQQYTDLITELRKPILVRAGSTVYEWKEGLVQGYKYSPALSELYYTEMDQIYFSQQLQRNENGIKLFVRVVDDYLYVTNSLEDALLFLKALSSYRNVNNKKTVVNFMHPDIKMNEEITFLGYSYNSSTLEVSRACNVFVGQICYKIAFTSAISNMPSFLQNRIGQSGIQINGHIFNLQYNSEETIWKHVFTTLCLSANKFCTILAVLCNEIDMQNYLMLYKKRVTVKLNNAMIEMLIKNKPKDYVFIFCINHFRYLSWKALSLCAKATPKCSGLVPLINNELAKTNCLYGKWKEHSSRMDSSGAFLRKATKEYCRRTDLRIIVKNFDILPVGFELFHHKKIK